MQFSIPMMNAVTRTQKKTREVISVLIGDKSKFAFQISNIDCNGQCEFGMYVNGADVLEGVIKGKRQKYCWNIDEIITWFQESKNELHSDDPYPVSVSGNSAAELYANSFQFTGNEEEEFDWYTQVQNWLFRHSWVNASAGSYLATVFFRRVGENMEISWDNSNHPHVAFVNQQGKYCVDLMEFDKTVDILCRRYCELKSKGK